MKNNIENNNKILHGNLGRYYTYTKILEPVITQSLAYFWGVNSSGHRAWWKRPGQELEKVFVLIKWDMNKQSPGFIEIWILLMILNIQCFITI